MVVVQGREPLRRGEDLRFVLRWSDEDGKEVITSSAVEVLQPSPQLTVLRATGLWAEETLWTVLHNAEGIRILRADWGVSDGSCRRDALETVNIDSRLQKAMDADMPRDGSKVDPEVVGQWVAMLEEIECHEVEKVLPKSRVWADFVSPASKTLEGQC